MPTPSIAQEKDVPRLSAVIDDPGNGFNAIRLMAALAVVASHSWLLLQPTIKQFWWAAYDAGAVGVNVFFVLSGLMLSRSFARHPDWRAFFVARVLRVFPGLVVAGAIIGWLIVPLASGHLNIAYYQDWHVIGFPATMAFLFNEAHLHEVFARSPMPLEANLPLWTIKYELAAYFAFGVALVIGLFRSRWFTLALTAILGVALTTFEAANVLQSSPVSQIVRFGFCFMVGVSFHAFRRSLPLNPVVACGALSLAFLSGWSALGPLLWIVAFGYGGLVLATVRIPVLTRLTNRWDISFGVYIYSWPIQQLLLANDGARSSIPVHFALAFVLVVPVALLSFVLVERPAMSARRAIVSWIDRVVHRRTGVKEAADGRPATLAPQPGGQSARSAA